MVVGHDMRLSSGALSSALIDGILSMGCDVVDIGLCGTEMVYYATALLLFFLRSAWRVFTSAWQDLRTQTPITQH